MVSTKKLINLARKWQKLAALKRKRITFSSTTETTDTYSCSTSGKAEKGCFVVYSADQKRFLLPLEYLNSKIIGELFNMAEEEFGLPSNGPLTLPCDSKLIEYAIDMIKKRVKGDVERALLTSITSFSLHDSIISHQTALCSF